jgi:glycolate oxidase FAD binding subunit
MSISPSLSPASVAELVEAVRSTPRILAVGAGTKPRLSAVEAVRLSTSKLKGILEYDPSEFTFTALAGTPLKEIVTVLAEQGQYLPFDPVFVAAGSTIGGAVAAGVSGPGRFRFGGLRDFILGIRFVDGMGRLLKMGGKVVKNAAGFDLPKFFVGSLGRFGVLVEVTFKVFPSPPARLTLRLATDGVESATRMLTEIANSRWEPEAVDLPPSPPRDDYLWVRLAGPAAAIEEISREILSRWPGEKVRAAEAEAMWAGLADFRWARDGGRLIKLALTAEVLPALTRAVENLYGVLHVSAGGNVGFVWILVNPSMLDKELRKLNLRGVGLRGDGPLWHGAHNNFEIANAVKNALDPNGRFPGLSE